MNLPFLVERYRNLLHIGVSALIVSTLLLTGGLLAAQVLRRRGPETVSFVLRLTLVGTVLGVALCVLLAGRLPVLWRLSLPEAEVAIVETVPSASPQSVVSVPALPVPVIASEEPSTPPRPSGRDARLSGIYA